MIVTYQSDALIRPCLQTLYEYAPADTSLRVTVVDNASSDGTLETIRSEFPAVEIIARATNDGFAVANNVALKTVESRNTLVLNPDTELHAGTLGHLIDYMEQHQDVGALGCRLLTAEGTLDHASKRAFPSPGTAVKYFLLKALGRTGSAYVRPDLADDAVADVDAINGAFMLIRTSAMREVGYLDEKYWMYGEDLDWCARFAKAGWRVVYDGRVTAGHLKAGTTGGKRSTRLNYHFHRSMWLFFRDHGSTGRKSGDAIVWVGVHGRFLMTSGLNWARSVIDRVRVT